MMVYVEQYIEPILLILLFNDFYLLFIMIENIISKNFYFRCFDGTWFWNSKSNLKLSERIFGDEKNKHLIQMINCTSMGGVTLTCLTIV